MGTMLGTAFFTSPSQEIEIRDHCLYFYQQGLCQQVLRPGLSPRIPQESIFYLAMAAPYPSPGLVNLFPSLLALFKGALSKSPLPPPGTL